MKVSYLLPGFVRNVEYFDEIKKLQEEVANLQHMHNGRHPFIDELSSSHHSHHLPRQKTKNT